MDFMWDDVAVEGLSELQTNLVAEVLSKTPSSTLKEPKSAPVDRMEKQTNNQIQMVMSSQH